VSRADTLAWRVTGASALGGFHAREGRPNQDAVGWTPAEGAGARIVAAVSDGHGASPHFRSERGARMAVEQALEVLSRHMEDQGPEEEALPQTVVSAWRQAVIADTEADPLFGRGARPGATLAPYGATLLAMAATAAELTLLQIGDGDLLLLYRDGRIVRPFARELELVGEQTYSLCQDDAETRVRTASFWRQGIDWPMAVLLASDGVSKSFRDEQGFRDAARVLTEHARRDWPGFTAELPHWLSAISHHGSGDDATLCIALSDAGMTNQREGHSHEPEPASA
jgi:serine/threonine protein phosphatase PrpC